MPIPDGHSPMPLITFTHYIIDVNKITDLYRLRLTRVD
jgi:hypothetical protein